MDKLGVKKPSCVMTFGVSNNRFKSASEIFVCAQRHAHLHDVVKASDWVFLVDGDCGDGGHKICSTTYCVAAILCRIMRRRSIRRFMY